VLIPITIVGLGSLAGLGDVAQIQQMIVDAANAAGVPPNLALGIVNHETGGTFNPNLVNSTLNSDGSWDSGLFQLNDSVLKTYGISRAQALDPQTNINTGISLLASLLSQYGDQATALWAYAQGSGTVAKSPNGPNALAQSFINSVLSYNAGPVLASMGVDSGTSDGSTDASDGGPSTGAMAAAAGVLALLVAAVLS
jgi:soluble lytic murein transglycosylase-like protein